MNLININTDAFVLKVEKDLGDLIEAKLYVEEVSQPVGLPAQKHVRYQSPSKAK
ncbi:hypothetical protein DPMN_099755 [Dreissena polymorpha]|uniref:Uncharacterized protein n=1 Tax=Dreissena polymorpha TaxID=45954 RepID=A0A9D4LFG9_DREPO|nr:hypothetical protein DPMN_099755 [Dreissena polymorpha]